MTPAFASILAAFSEAPVAVEGAWQPAVSVALQTVSAPTELVGPA